MANWCHLQRTTHDINRWLLQNSKQIKCVWLNWFTGIWYDSLKHIMEKSFVQNATKNVQYIYSFICSIHWLEFRFKNFFLLIFSVEKNAYRNWPKCVPIMNRSLNFIIRQKYVEFARHHTDKWHDTHQLNDQVLIWTCIQTVSRWHMIACSFLFVLLKLIWLIEALQLFDLFEFAIFNHWNNVK